MTLSRWWPTAALALALAGGALYYGHVQRQIGARDAALTTLSTSYAHLAARKQAVDTVYRADTLRLTRWRTLLKDRAETLIVTDTIKVREFIATADSTIGACTVALTTCEERVRIRDAMLANRDSALRVLRAKRITVKPRCVVGPSLSTDGRVRVGVSCGIGF